MGSSKTVYNALHGDDVDDDDDDGDDGDDGDGRRCELVYGG